MNIFITHNIIMYYHLLKGFTKNKGSLGFEV